MNTSCSNEILTPETSALNHRATGIKYKMSQRKNRAPKPIATMTHTLAFSMLFIL
jgi:hypothetical protein